MEYKKKKILLISSAGGHFAQLMKLKPLFERYDYKILTEYVPSSESVKNGYNIEFLSNISKGRGAGMLMNMVKYSLQAIKEFIRNKPDVIITTGSYPAIPYCFIGKLFGIKVVYILSFARVKTKAKSADILYKISDVFIVQWKGNLQSYPKGIYLGGGLY